MKAATARTVAVQESTHRLKCQGCGAATNRIAVIEKEDYNLYIPRCTTHLGIPEENDAWQAQILEAAQ